MSLRRAPHQRSAPAAALLACLVSATTVPAAAVAPAPTPTAAPTFEVRRTPCPGTLVPQPPAPTSRPGRPTPTTTTPTPTGPAQRYPGPTVDAGAHPVGGDRLGGAALVSDLPAGVPAAPQLDATAYLLADLATGQVLVAKAPHAHLYPASTLKTLTALTVMGDLDPHKVIVAVPEDQAAEGTRAGMVAGNPYRTDQLWSAVLMLSANDAAYALARSAPGGRPATLRRMNETAASLGAHDTVAVDPSGLDAQGQRSSAYDLAVIGRAAMQRPDFRRYVTQREVMFPGARLADGRTVAPYPIQNLDRFFLHYPGATGVKTGYTTGAHRTYIQSATRGGRSYLLTVMCSDTVDWQSMGTMMDWAFAHAAKARPVGTLVVGGPGAPTTSPASSGPPTGSGPEGQASAPPARASSSAVAEPAATARHAQGGAGRWWGAGALVAVLLGLGALLIRRRRG